MLYSFETLPKELKAVGGKAYMLAMMLQDGLPIPTGFIIHESFTAEDEENLRSFYLSRNFSLAVRSSASAEDSKDHSFAGQNTTFLYVENLEELISAVKKCFSSINNESSKSYRQNISTAVESRMNVVIQEMVDPAYAGVFFSKDPTGATSDWLLEYIDGVGEDLVSGKRTPKKVYPNTIVENEDLSQENLNELVSHCHRIEGLYDDKFDIEWAISKTGEVYILQSRPITTLKDLDSKKIATQELERLKNEFSEDTYWDGQTFSELTVCPSTFSFSLWEKSFAPGGGFDLALKELGYLGFEDNQSKSLLDSIFGRSYINLERLGPLYFGPIPYRINPIPRVHLEFRLSKLNFETIVKTPKTVFKMLSVAMSINTHRRPFIEKSRENLIAFSTIMEKGSGPESYADFETHKLIERLQKESHIFSTKTLLWPYVLISLTETTHQSLFSYLKGVTGESEAEQIITRWMGTGLQTETYDMTRYFNKACAYPEVRQLFMQKYGHRCPGELDLNSKRWEEMGDDAFFELSPSEYEELKSSHSICDIAAEIEELKTIKKALILEEWLLLKDLLELREKWKMALLKQFSHIRYMLLELSKRLEIPNDLVFYITLDEISDYAKSILSTAQERKLRSLALSRYNFSTVTCLKEIKDTLENNVPVENSMKGEGISTGLVKGEVVIINSMADVSKIKWPKNPIIVAKATDPGWTPVFIRAKGIIVERGGALSHCAIVAREMGIPAVSGIKNCYINLKEGQNVWINGNDGTVTAVQ
ncbi:PEP/pyruvate-binding domain-containing protein [Bacteriovorax sp. Seq25_V]|uniref:PEP/pyruvate-binding domain-containing protein n=1 Tax=Bacteriovorax sp. Seq25_V TaxID=1201288 RepID=UPI00038A4C08|nr:PEP/pyruvate-binding domain-containing protein [Bacteriovorax sp. Seq25_V]EQC44014.1 PEP-utilizing enzyme, mobile domain protein [Bacteriovorax sp. Seq25_V]